MLNNIRSKTGILTVVALCCFAGNSLLCRAALGNQLSVPVIALIGSSLFLGEIVTMRTIASIVLILGGIAFSLRSMKSS